MSKPKSGPFHSLGQIPAVATTDQVVLHPIQFEAFGIRPATIFSFDPDAATTTVADGNTLVLYDGSNAAETYTFKNTAAVPFDVQIAASDAVATLQNLAAEILLSSVEYKAVYVDNLQVHSNQTRPLLNKVVIIAAENSSPIFAHRLWGTFLSAAAARYVAFENNGPSYIFDSSNELIPMLSSDPGIKAGFGFAASGAVSIPRGEVRVTINPPMLWQRFVSQPTTASHWRPLSINRKVIPICDTHETDHVTGQISVAQFEFNPLDYVFGVNEPDYAVNTELFFKFEATLTTSKAATITAQVILYNLTDSLTVATLTAMGTTYVLDTTDLVVGVAPTNIKPESKIYEIRVNVTGGTDGTDIAYLGTTRLVMY